MVTIFDEFSLVSATCWDDIGHAINMLLTVYGVAVQVLWSEQRLRLVRAVRQCRAGLVLSEHGVWSAGHHSSLQSGE